MSAAISTGGTQDLQLYSAARIALQNAVRVDEVKTIRDKAAAMAAYARQANDTELISWASEIKIRAERRAGELLRDTPKAAGAKGIGTSAVPRGDRTPPTLAQLGISKKQSSRWQKLAAVPEDKFEQAVSAALEVTSEVAAHVFRAVDARNHRAQDTNEWYTPSEHIEIARRVLGTIDLDPASCDAANKVVQATRFFSKVDDGLRQPWSGTVWLNPPYSKPNISQFVDKLLGEFKSGSVTEAILLTHCYVDTNWFHTAAPIAGAVCFPKGRIRFTRPTAGADGDGQPDRGQMFLYFGPDVRKFQEVFSEVGLVMTVAA